MSHFRSLIVLLVLSLPALAASSTTTLTVPQSPVMLGSQVTLRAAVSPGTATGNVTFYDGSSVVGVGRVSAGAATLTTRLLGAGKHELRARYNGDSVSDFSVSAVVPLTIQSVASQGFLPNTLPLSLDLQFSDFIAADFNGDGRADLAVNDSTGRTLKILIGGDNVSFTAKPTISTGPQQVFSMTAADLNGDGAVDLAMPDTSGSTRIFLGDGSGAFQQAGTVAIFGTRIVNADMNNDGIVDLVTTNGPSRILLSWWLWGRAMGPSAWLRLSLRKRAHGSRSPTSTGMDGPMSRATLRHRFRLRLVWRS